MASTHKTPSAETVRRAVAIRARAWLRTHYDGGPEQGSADLAPHRRPSRATTTAPTGGSRPPGH
jgi:hypothetical protein